LYKLITPGETTGKSVSINGVNALEIVFSSTSVLSIFIIWKVGFSGALSEERAAGKDIWSLIHDPNA
jgi:hypothetical protein